MYRPAPRSACKNHNGVNGSGWLTASAAGNAVTVNANGSQLTQGAYQGVVTVFVPGAGNSPLYIPVTLSVGPAPTITVTPTSVMFNYASGSTTLPAPQAVQVTSTGSATFTATFTPSASIANRGNFITVTPAMRHLRRRPLRWRLTLQFWRRFRRVFTPEPLPYLRRE